MTQMDQNPILYGKINKDQKQTPKKLIGNNILFEDNYYNDKKHSQQLVYQDYNNQNQLQQLYGGIAINKNTIQKLQQIQAIKNNVNKNNLLNFINIPKNNIFETKSDKAQSLLIENYKTP